jgi:hypothetical protein
MPWEHVRDLGLIIFVCGGIVLFGLNIIGRRTPLPPDSWWIRNVGDAMMLGGACLAVMAMFVGYWASSGGP